MSGKGNPIIDKFYGNGYSGDIAPSKNAAGISMKISIDVPFTAVMNKLVEQVKAGIIDRETYDAILENYDRIVNQYRSAKL